MVEEAGCIVAMQRLEDCQGLCVTGRPSSSVPGAGAASFLLQVEAVRAERYSLSVFNKQ